MRTVALLLTVFAVGMLPLTLMASVRGFDQYVVISSPPPTCAADYKWSI